MYESEREDLINSLRKKGIKDENVLNAMLQVERHLFVPDVVKMHAYKDIALPIGHGQTISQPYTVAVMTQALSLNPNDKILEIGTGSGYQAAVLNKIGVKVITIERNNEIYNSALKLCDLLQLRIASRCSDGTIGWDEFAPYHGIIVTAGGPSIPKKLIKQLAVDGKLVIPVGDRKNQTLNIITKIDEETFKIKEVPNFAFVPLIGREGWKN